VVTDGPYAESKDLVTGNLVVEASSLEEATELARDCQSSNSTDPSKFARFSKRRREQVDEAARAGALADDLFRRESARLLAALTRLLAANVALAEDVVQEALLSALQAWRFGLPEDPQGWILKTARNKAIDEIRRQARFGRISEELAAAPTLSDRIDAALSDEGTARINWR